MDIVEKRITNLEDILAQTLRTVEQTSREMREFKEEMRASREVTQWEMQEFKETSQREMFEFKEEMRASREASERKMFEFKEEMRASREASERKMQEFKETSEREMREFKEEMRTSHKEMDRRMNRQWGEFSRIIGRMAEDLVAPSIPRILRTTINCQDIDFTYVNVNKRCKNKEAEYDVVAGSGDYILINETKNKLRSEDIKHFAEKVLPKARDFFPEYADKKFIGAIASLYVNKQQVKDGEKRGIIVLGFGQDVMEVLNSKGFSPRIF